MKTNRPRGAYVSAIDGFAAVRVVRDAGGEPRSSSSSSSSRGEPIRLMLAGGREMILPASMPIGRLVELAVTLEREGERAS